MKLFNLTFEESQSLVNEDIINKVRIRGNYKRFIGFIIFSLLLYILFLIVPILISGNTVYTVQNFSWINWPLIFFFLLLYLIYIFFSVRYRRNPMLQKYITLCYMLFLTFIMAIGITLAIASRRSILGLSSGLLFAIVCFYLFRTVPRKLKEAVVNREPFMPMAVLITNKVTEGLILLSGTGITGLLALFDRTTGSNTRASINTFLMPFAPALFLFATYVFSIDLLRGYYLFKYSEQYRAQFGYSVADWYGAKSREHLDVQNKNESFE